MSVWCGIIATGIWWVGGHLLNVALAAGGLVFAVGPAISLLEATIQHRQAEIARIRAEIDAWNKPRG